jgi:GNAT superfamily N-acetyltransferase
MVAPVEPRRASAYAERLRRAISPATPADRAELLEFRRRMYGRESAYADPAWVRWLFDERRDNGLWIWRHGGRIEGQQGAIRTSLCVAGEERSLSWGIDLMVSPEHRKRGVGAVLPEVLAEGAEILAGTEVSEAAQRALERAGWSTLGTIPQWVRPVEPSRFLSERLGVRVGRVASAPLRVALDAMVTVGALARLGHRLVPLASFDTRADDVWSRCSREWPIVARRDRQWLAWRWDACPRREGLRALWLERRGETVGWVVVRTQEHKGVRAAFVVDFLCPPADVSALFGLVVAELRKEPIDAVYCLLLAPGVERAMLGNGFVRRDSKLVTMVWAPSVPARLRARLVDRSQWFLTAGDSDLDRPREHTHFA